MFFHKELWSQLSNLNAILQKRELCRFDLWRRGCFWYMNNLPFGRSKYMRIRQICTLSYVSFATPVYDKQSINQENICATGTRFA